MPRKRRQRARRGGATIDLGAADPPNPAKAWSEVIERFTGLLQLENKRDRLQAGRLMLALEREALAVFKIARRLDDPDLTPKDWPKVRQHHARDSLIARLRNDFTQRQIDLARLGGLHARLDRRHWYDQGGMLLDAVEHLRINIALYEFILGRIRRRPRGRPPSVAWDFLVTEQAKFGLSDEEVMLALLSLGIKVDNEVNRALLQDNVRKHRERHRQQRRLDG